MSSKTFTIICSIILISTVILPSCKKSKLNKATTTSEDNATAETLFNDVFNIGEQQDGELENAGKTGKISGPDDDTTITIDCVTLSREILDTSGWPREITIDFGDGCEGRDGRIRSGKIIIHRTGLYRDEGSVHTYTTENFNVDGYRIEGSRTVTHMPTGGNTTFSIVVKDGKITAPSGETITWESSRTREWSEGEETTFFTDGIKGILDDVYLIDGTASGTNREGRAFTMEITTPLKVRLNCRWIVSGKMELQPEDLKKRTIDFGDGECDNEAVVTIASHTYVIQLRK